MNKSRFTGFSDAIIAIEVTVLILEIEPPARDSLHEVLSQAGSIIAYITSFLLIMITWFNHHNIIRVARHVNLPVYLANTLWVFVMSLIPVATAWVGRYPLQSVPEANYALLSIAWMGTYSLLMYALTKANPGQRADFQLLGNGQQRDVWYRFTLTGIVLLLTPIFPLAGIGGVIISAVTGMVVISRHTSAVVKMDKERMIAFTDGIIAIIVTLLVLQLAVPAGMHWQSLLSQGTKFGAYAISFLFIMLVWYNHHDLFNTTKTFTARIYWDNMLWLLCLSFFPYVTAYVGEFPNSRLAEMLYVIVQLLWSLSYTVMARDLKRLNPRETEQIDFVGKLTGYSATTLYGGLIIALIAVLIVPISGLIVTILLALVNLLRALREDRQREAIRAQKEEQ